MNILLISIFVIAYAAIAFEHPIKINKSASALLGAGLLWSVYALMVGEGGHVSDHLGETLIGTAQIVFFLMGAMTIVEVIDAHDGFDVVTVRIRTTSLSSLMWLVGIVTFFLSAVLDNLTTAIVMVSLMKKLLDKREERLLFAGMIVIAANAGGAWSPIGDVTTTMLWIGGQITASSIMGALILPSLVNLLVPLALVSYRLRGKTVVEPKQDPNHPQGAGTGGSILIIGSAAGVAAMGLERIDFVWYVKNISLLAIGGYFAGALVYILQVTLLS